MARSVVVIAAGACLLLAAPARAESGNYRRAEVIQLTKVQSWSKVSRLRDWQLGQQKGTVCAVSERALDPYEGSARFRMVFVPDDRSKPVKILTAKQTREAGYRTIAEARKVAKELGPGATFAWALPLRNVRLYATTSHHAKHRGTGLSYLFAAEPSRPSPGAPIEQIRLGVPMLRSQVRGETAAPHLPERRYNTPPQ